VIRAGFPPQRGRFPKIDFPGRPIFGFGRVSVTAAAEVGRLSFGKVRDNVSVLFAARGLSIVGLRMRHRTSAAVECAAPREEF
jgi:hypothetical protein